MQTYELVDKHIRRLDSDLAKFEAEMREKGGRLSQTETEDEGEEVDTKKKGKKKTGTSVLDKSGSALKDVGKSGKKRGKKEVSTPVVEEKKKKKGGATPKLSETPMASIAASLLPVPQEVLDMPVDPNEPTYCLCQQVLVSFNSMICKCFKKLSCLRREYFLLKVKGPAFWLNCLEKWLMKFSNRFRTAR